MRYETSYETSPTSVLYINYFAVVVLFIAHILHQRELVYLQSMETTAWPWGRASCKPQPLQVSSSKPCLSQTTLQPGATPPNRAELPYRVRKGPRQHEHHFRPCVNGVNGPGTITLVHQESQSLPVGAAKVNGIRLVSSQRAHGPGARAEDSPLHPHKD